MSLTITSKTYELRVEGTLNPAIFTVGWYSKHFEGMDVKGSATSVPSFITLGGLTINCDYDCWVASFNSEESCIEAISVANRVFTELLSHTPVTEAGLTVFSTSKNETWNSTALASQGLLANGLLENAANSKHVYVHWKEQDEPQMTVMCWTCSHPSHFHTRHTFEFQLTDTRAIKTIIGNHDDLLSRASVSGDVIMKKLIAGST